MQLLARSAVLVALLLLASCRLKTKYDLDTTKACVDRSLAGQADGGPGYDWNRACKDCCHEKGMTAVDPGGCECGELGLDALLK